MKKVRLGKIIEIIEKRDVETQEELAALLKEAKTKGSISFMNAAI